MRLPLPCGCSTFCSNSKILGWYRLTPLVLSCMSSDPCLEVFDFDIVLLLRKRLADRANTP